MRHLLTAAAKIHWFWVDYLPSRNLWDLVSSDNWLSILLVGPVWQFSMNNNSNWSFPSVSVVILETCVHESIRSSNHSVIYWPFLYYLYLVFGRKFLGLLSSRPVDGEISQTVSNSMHSDFVFLALFLAGYIILRPRQPSLSRLLCWQTLNKFQQFKL